MLRILLVDDEAPARMRLSALLAEVTDPLVDVVAQVEDATQAELVLAREPVDLVLLDIGLPGQDGIRLAARWRGLPGSPAVVFVTAHAEHAVRAFELDAVDYLTKPVRRDRLLAALQRVARRQSSTRPEAQTRVLVIQDRGRVLRLPLAELIYLKAEQKYVMLRTASHRHLIDESLADLEPRLGEGFMRVHRNAIVARQAVRALERHGLPDGDTDGWAVRVAPTDEWLAVSRRQLAAVRQALDAPRP